MKGTDTEAALGGGGDLAHTSPKKSISTLRRRLVEKKF